MSRKTLDLFTSFDPFIMVLSFLFCSGATARQRVELPNEYFHPCEEAPFSCLQGDHSVSGRQPCWKCWATYILSPAPLQGFEFESSLILSSSLFNIIEAMPVMPGPCQLLKWQQMKKFKIVDEYFNLLFNEEDLTVSKRGNIIRSLPKGFKASRQRTSLASSSSHGEASDHSSTIVSSTTASSEPPKPSLTFTEFLRVNMRLAEDRILSFVCVFSTGMGTKWITGATFFYQPEIRLQSLLTQRQVAINWSLRFPVTDPT